MFKRLVDEDYEIYTDNGLKLANEIKEAVCPIIENLIDEGYAMVDISHIIFDEVSYILADKKLLRNRYLRRMSHKHDKIC